uniref:Uncharacterized protein n=1 Tax=Arundo donax TaxID=35708 RepID=A0A0A9HNP9_ARUDO
MLPVTARSRLSSLPARPQRPQRCRITKVEVQPHRLGSFHPRTTSCRRFTPSRRVDKLASESRRL